MREPQRVVGMPPSVGTRSRVRLAPPPSLADSAAVSPPCFALLSALRGEQAESAAEAVDVGALAYAAAARLRRRDAIVSVAAAPLGDADGALYETGAGGWMLLHREGLDAAEARVVQAWLLGCYALHGREAGAFECRLRDLYHLGDIDSASARAYSFATRLLMPDGVCRDALPRTVDAEGLLAFATRLHVPVWHAARRWIDRTAQKAVLLLDEAGSVRACWLSETAYGAGLHLDIDTTSARLRQRLADGATSAMDGDERAVAVSDWLDADVAASAAPTQPIYETRVVIPSLGNGSHTLTLLRFPRALRVAQRHAWRQYGHWAVAAR